MVLQPPLNENKPASAWKEQKSQRDVTYAVIFVPSRWSTIKIQPCGNNTAQNSALLHDGIRSQAKFS